MLFLFSDDFIIQGIVVIHYEIHQNGINKNVLFKYLVNVYFVDKIRFGRLAPDGFTRASRV